MKNTTDNKPPATSALPRRAGSLAAMWREKVKDLRHLGNQVPSEIQPSAIKQRMLDKADQLEMCAQQLEDIVSANNEA